MKRKHDITQLMVWLRQATVDERARLADAAGVSVEYLYQLAGIHKENPKVRLALGLRDGAQILRRINRRLPKLTVEDLAAPTRRGRYDK